MLRAAVLRTLGRSCLVRSMDVRRTSVPLNRMMNVASCQYSQVACSNGSLRRAAHPRGTSADFTPAFRPVIGRETRLNPICASDSQSDLPTPPPNPSPTGFLSTQAAQSACYAFLYATSAAFAAVATLFPSVLISVALPGAAVGPLDETFCRVAGATMVISAAVEYCIKDAVDNKRTKSATYQRLMLGCAFKSAAFLAAFAQASTLWNPLLVAFYPTLAASSLVINLTVWRHASAASASTPAGDQLIAIPQSTAGWVYSVFAFLYVATAAACYLPEAIFLGDLTPTSVLLKQTWAPGFLLAATACLVLRGAADRGRLGAGTFKRLNLGLAGTELVYASLLAASAATGLARGDASVVSNAAGSLVIAAFCLYTYSTAKK